ncbi:MAG TPA: MIP family channel protein [Bacteroidota bacterium]|nr:MIP family channel protein [Bacteroidota bacterium]
MKKYTAEAIGTFGLVFFGTGAIVVDEITRGAVTHIGVSMTFGLIVLSMIFGFGDISGAHLNPAVTIGFWSSGRFPGREVLPYILSQSIGAIGASVLLLLLFPQSATLGMTNPAGSAIQSFILEIVLTFFLMLVIMSVSEGSKEKGMFAAIAIGSVIMLEALFAGPVSGASMNPARSLGPAVMMGRYNTLWIYLLAPPLGSLIAVITWRFFRKDRIPPS